MSNMLVNDRFVSSLEVKQTSMQDQSVDIIVVGGGIVGLAHAYMALKKGYKVALFEREHFAIGASVRNFGLVWPIGQEPGAGLDRALRSRQHWLDVTADAGCWINTSGSLHLAYHEDERRVLEEFMALYAGTDGYAYEWLSPGAVREKAPAVRENGLKGALFSTTECTVNPREVIRRIPVWLHEKHGLILKFGQTVTQISFPRVSTSTETWKADKIYVCNGADFETLYPTLFQQRDITKCKLQMMKATIPQKTFDLGPSLCAGLTLRHYAAFSRCTSLRDLDARYDHEAPVFKEHGVHVLVSQNNSGELIIGDSHHYGKTVEPFDNESVNEIILDYLRSFTQFEGLQITERWHGVYPKAQGQLNLLVEPEPGVTIVNGLGGAGMTLSFGLAEEVIGAL